MKAVLQVVRTGDIIVPIVRYRLYPESSNLRGVEDATGSRSGRNC